MNEDELQVAFARLRDEHAPPLRLTPDAVLSAGQQARRRRRAMTAGIVVATAAAVATPVLLSISLGAGDRSTPAPPGAPPTVVDTVRPPQPKMPTGGPIHTQAPPAPPMTQAPPSPDSTAGSPRSSEGSQRR
ncbi:hypothetical protein ACGF7U_01385 [Micromonospora sp. NPDC047670]|uniref:hypothetical protein n=1 Tax=Micromonospora sp. NPDC047670 TaxID=3364252 RepID=UPI0037195F7A